LKDDFENTATHGSADHLVTIMGSLAPSNIEVGKEGLDGLFKRHAMYGQFISFEVVFEVYWLELIPPHHRSSLLGPRGDTVIAALHPRPKESSSAWMSRANRSTVTPSTPAKPPFFRTRSQARRSISGMRQGTVVGLLREVRAHPAGGGALTKVRRG
jgi:hypothetical protein